MRGHSARGYLRPRTPDARHSVSRLSPRETLVLAALAVAGDESLSADQLAEVVWGDTPPASWHKNLQTCVVRLRRSLVPMPSEPPAAATVSPSRSRLSTPAGSKRSPPARRAPRARRGRPAAYLQDQALALGGRQYTELEEWEPGSLKAPPRSESASTPRNGGSKPPSRPGATATISPRPRHWPNAAPLRKRRGSCSPWPVSRRQAGPTCDHLQSQMPLEELGIDLGPGLGELEQAILRQDADLDTVEAR